ncbi:hypothetical protein JXA70_21655 [candidate division KSB1 bacterium]|nr:hypothetical protein [candidate division KSB1 bacterium]
MKTNTTLFRKSILCMCLTVVMLIGCGKDQAEPAPEVAVKTTVEFVKWLGDYIPENYPGVQTVPHEEGRWFQASITDVDLVVSWAKLLEESLPLKNVHGLSEGKSLFIDNPKDEWADVESVTRMGDAGYYVSGYNSATMGDWDVGQLTVVQYDGDSKKFTEEMARAWLSTSR